MACVIGIIYYNHDFCFVLLLFIAVDRLRVWGRLGVFVVFGQQRCWRWWWWRRRRHVDRNRLQETVFGRLSCKYNHHEKISSQQLRTTAIVHGIVRQIHGHIVGDVTAQISLTGTEGHARRFGQIQIYGTGTRSTMSVYNMTSSSVLFLYYNVHLYQICEIIRFVVYFFVKIILMVVSSTFLYRAQLYFHTFIARVWHNTYANDI